MTLPFIQDLLSLEDPEEYTGATLAADLALGFTPGVGEVMSGRDLVRDVRAGRPGWALLSAAGMIPLLGIPARAIRRGRSVAKAAKGISQSADAADVLGDLWSAAKRVGTKKGARELPEGMGDLFPQSLLGQEPKVLKRPQVPHPVVPDVPITAEAGQRYMESAQEAIEALSSPQMIDAVERGVAKGGHLWYDLDPLAQRFVAELGEIEGLGSFDELMGDIAITSKGTATPASIRQASNLFFLRGNRLLPTDMPTGKAERQALGGLFAPRSAPRFPAGSVEEAIGARPWISGSAPKRPRYAANLMGNWMPGTLDRHVNRQIRMGLKPGQEILGLTDDAFNPNLYGPLEANMQELAANLQGAGILPTIPGRSPTAMLQAAPWVSLAEETGQLSGDLPMLSLFEERLLRTGENVGKSAEDVLGRFIRREMPLLGISGALLGGGMASRQARNRGGYDL